MTGQSHSALFHEIFAATVFALKTNDAYSTAKAETIAEFARASAEPHERTIMRDALKLKLEEFERVNTANGASARFRDTLIALRRAHHKLDSEVTKPVGAPETRSTDFGRRGSGHQRY